MPMMPNRLPTHIPSSKITARARTRTAEPHTAAPVAAESALSRAGYLGGLGPQARTRRPTEV